MPPQANPVPFFVDVFPFNDEIAMLRYRLQLHAPLAIRTIIAESQWTFSGARKPLHALASLTADEIAKYRIHLLDMPLSAHNESRASFSTRASFSIEITHRQYLQSAINKAITDLLLTPEVREHGDDLLVYVSDVDELLDLDSLTRAVRRVGTQALFAPGGCRTPTQRLYYYSEHCPSSSSKSKWAGPWRRSVLFRARSGFLTYFEDQQRLIGELDESGHDNGNGSSLELRKLYRLTDPHNSSLMCKPTEGFVGWHLSYFFDSSVIAAKLASFAHHLDFRSILSLNSSALLAHLDRSAHKCLEMRGQPQFQMNLERAAVPFDGVLPSLSGWPRHPQAPTLAHFKREAAAAGDARVIAEMKRALPRSSEEDARLKDGAALYAWGNVIGHVCQHCIRANKTYLAQIVKERGWYGAPWKVLYDSNSKRNVIEGKLRILATES